MSRGLGWLQREILATLDAAKQAPWDRYSSSMKYRGTGCERHPDKSWRWDRAGWIWYRKACVRLADGVYDLRASAAFLARTHQGMDRQWIRGAWKAAFSRAVHGLVQRNQLTPMWLVPLAEIDEDSHAKARVHELADGFYLEVNSRHRRFVSR